MNSYKKAWYFIRHYKINLVAMVILMVLVQFLNMLSPLIIKNIIDENLVGISHPWTQVYVEDESTVSYNGMYLKQIDAPISSDSNYYSIVMHDDKYYIIPTLIDSQHQYEFVDNQVIIDGVIYPATPLSVDEVKLFYNPFIPNLIMLISLLFIVSMTSIILSYFQRLTGAYITINATRDVRIEAMQRIQYLPLQMLEDEPAGKTANRILNDSTGVSGLYTVSLNIFFSTIVSIIFSFIGMWILDPRLATICLVIIPIMTLWIRWFTKRINIVATNVQETNSRMIGSINEIINGIGILKIFNRDKETIDDFASLNDDYVDQSMKEVNLHITRGWNGISLFQGIVGGFVIIFFSVQNLNSNVVVEAGVIYAYYNYITRLISPIGALFHSFGELENSKVKIERIFKIFDAKLEDDIIVTTSPYLGNVKFENVTFSYNQGHPVLKNINLEFLKGQKIGLVGHTGSGKSTMMNLLMRFNDLSSFDHGCILIDDQDITSVSKRTYRQHIGIILQEPILFSGTIYDNICFGTSVEKEQAIQMLIDVGGKKLLDKLENGIDELLSRKGNNLSLGEKQLISFARILVSNPSVIVMDEATANIDTETEEMIAKALEVITKNRTTIVIAHRLSTIIDSDQIIVLQKGEVIESGNHDDLLIKDGYYANMYRAQVGNGE